MNHIPASPNGARQYLPTNYQAEQALLGALLANNRAYERVGPLLPEHFADPINGAIYAAIQNRIENGQVADLLTVQEDFKGRDDLAPVGGHAYLGQLLSAMISIVNAGDYARMIIGMWQRREIIRIGEAMAHAAYDGADMDGLSHISAAEEELYKLISHRGREAHEKHIGDAAARVVEGMQDAIEGKLPTIYSTGIPEIDALIGGGMRPQQEILLGGRPGHGKSSLSLQMQIFFAETYGLPSLNISIEMTAEEQAARALSQLTGVPAWRIELGQVSPSEADMILKAKRHLRQLEIVFDDRPGLSYRDIRHAVRRFKRLHGQLGLLVIDHLHIVKPDRELLKSAGLAYAVGEISTRLKELAKEEDCPVLALCQLNRSKESADDKMPSMGDLKNSGDLEANADTILFVHRPELHLHKGKPSRKPNESDSDFHDREMNYMQALQEAQGVGYVNIGKARKGPGGTVRLEFDGATTSFRPHAA